MTDTAIDIIPVKRPGRFTDALDAYFTGVVLPKYVDKRINGDLIEEMRQEVLVRLRTIIQKASFRTHEDLISWLGNEYFYSIEINGMRIGQLVSPAVASLERVPEADLRRYRDIYRDTDIGDKLEVALTERAH